MKTSRWLRTWTTTMKAMLLIITSALVTLSCGDDDSEPADAGFDRSELLESLATNLIIPNFETLQSSVATLSSATSAFVEQADEANLTALRSAWVQAVKDYQHCSAFGFGPGNLTLGAFSTVLGVFPVDEAQVEANILDDDFNLSAAFDRDIRGFYAVEYLIYRENLTDAMVVATFDDDRKDYLLLIMGELATTFDNIVAEWNTTYLQEFVSEDGTAAGSPISLLYNEWVKDYEILKNFKLELPGGLTAGEPVNPALVEAYYSGISRDLIVEHFENSKNVWLGRSRSGSDLTGFRSYLETVVGGPELIESTLTAIDGIDAGIVALPMGRLSDNIEAPEIGALRDELQNNTANFKSSMSSLLGISITFNSGDGD
ncbi:MAG: imelysin family protein [Bacteroidota bacterium]